MTYSNGNSISNCGTIDLGTNQNTTISFWINLSKDSNQVVGDGDLYVYTKSNVNDVSENQVYWSHILSSYWTNNNTQYSEYTIPAITLQSQMFNTTGGVLFVRYVSSSNTKYYSCNYSIIKDETPTFTISPSSTNVTCDSASPKTFTVTNVYNSEGTKTYKWQVGSSWLYNGSPAPSYITTTANTITLVPNNFPPSNIKVATIFNDTELDYSTSIVNMTSYDPNYDIIGANSLCSTATYSINNLQNGTTITSWSSSDTNIATVSAINNYQATVTKTGNGSVTISAIVQNSCGQSKSFTKNIDVGSPSFASGSMTGESDPFTGDFEQYTVPVASGASNYDWYFDVGGVLGTSIDGWKIVLDQNTNFVNITVGNPGLAILVCKATNSCGGTTKYKYITAHSKSGGGGGGTDPCLTSLKFSSNPMTSGVSTNKIIIIDDPCLNPTMKNVGVTTTNHSITIYNRYSSKVYSKTQKDKEFNINNLPKGIYIVKYKNTKGRTFTKNLLIN